MRRIDISKEFLEQEYLVNKIAFQKIADKLGCTKSTVMDRAKEFGIESRSGGRIPLDVCGKKFGNLLVLHREGTDDHKHPTYLCKCDCGNNASVTAYALMSGDTQRCWDCRNKMISERKWRGYGELSGDFWWSIKRSARDRNFSFEITIEEAWNLFEKQKRRCALSGLELTFSRSKRANGSASLDRIDSNIGYVISNVQWVHKTLNNLKMDLNQEDFVRWCKLVSAHFSEIA